MVLANVSDSLKTLFCATLALYFFFPCISPYFSFCLSSKWEMNVAMRGGRYRPADVTTALNLKLNTRNFKADIKSIGLLAPSQVDFVFVDLGEVSAVVGGRSVQGAHVPEQSLSLLDAHLGVQQQFHSVQNGKERFADAQLLVNHLWSDWNRGNQAEFQESVWLDLLFSHSSLIWYGWRQRSLRSLWIKMLIRSRVCLMWEQITWITPFTCDSPIRANFFSNSSSFWFFFNRYGKIQSISPIGLVFYLTSSIDPSNKSTSLVKAVRAADERPLNSLAARRSSKSPLTTCSSSQVISLTAFWSHFVIYTIDGHFKLPKLPRNTFSTTGFVLSNNVNIWVRIAKVSRGSFLKLWSKSSLFSIIDRISPNTFSNRVTCLSIVSVMLPSTIFVKHYPNLSCNDHLLPVVAMNAANIEWLSSKNRFTSSCRLSMKRMATSGVSTISSFIAGLESSSNMILNKYIQN